MTSSIVYIQPTNYNIVNSFSRAIGAIDYYDGEFSNGLYKNGVELDNQILIWTSVNELIKEWKGAQQ